VRKALKKAGMIKQDIKISQTFEKGAYNENENGSSEEDSDLEDDEEQPMDSQRQSIREKMVPFVKYYLRILKKKRRLTN